MTARQYAPNKRITGYCTKDQPCSEITADAAAALAAASQLLKGDNPAWAAKALEHAKQVGGAGPPGPCCLAQRLLPACALAAGRLAAGAPPPRVPAACHLDRSAHPPTLPFNSTRQLYKFATEYPGSYMDSTDPAMLVRTMRCLPPARVAVLPCPGRSAARCLRAARHRGPCSRSAPAAA